MLIPAGSLHEPAGVNGTAAALCDLVTHGAGDLDHRQLSSTLDNLGVQRHEHVGWQFLSFGGSMLANNLAASLALYADVVLRPHLLEEEFESVLTGLNQSLLAMEDEPQRKLATELRRRTYRDPWGRPTEGDLRELPNVTMATVRGQFERGFRPNGAILGIAGNLDVPALKEQVWRLFGDWGSKPEMTPVAGSSGPAIDHVEHPSTQVQIGIAFPAPAWPMATPTITPPGQRRASSAAGPVLASSPRSASAGGSATRFRPARTASKPRGAR
jgi:predicted Zn-dependent peptidase